MNIEFKQLTEIEKSEMIELMNHSLVRRHMPLANGNFDISDCDALIGAKEKLWTDHGYGPWAFLVDGHFVGWGGLQPEKGEPDLGLVLHPRYWGMGKVLYYEVIRRAFGEMGFESVTALLPPTRNVTRGMLRLGFKPDGELKVSGERFHRYRLGKQMKEELHGD
jgi:RimJ/RimL family protein N-acetyltransferase